MEKEISKLCQGYLLVLSWYNDYVTMSDLFENTGILNIWVLWFNAFMITGKMKENSSIM